MRILKLVFAIVILLPSLGYSQPSDKIFENTEEALADPVGVTKFYLDCSSGEDSAFFASIARFPNLKSLTIVGYNEKTFPAALFQCQSLTTIAFTECSDLDFRSLIVALRSLSQLEQLTIDESELLVVPPEIAQLATLNKLIITNCDNLNVESSIEVLAACKSLQYLGLPVNDICELPDNIGKLNKIQILDISNNALFDFPESMSQMNNLSTLYTTNNLFINPVDAISKVSPLQIRYLAVDSTLSPEEKLKLSELFPEATIGFSSPGDLSTSVEEIPDSATYGEFRTLDGKFQILSEAYLHYARLFNFNPGFDSLLFEERYADPRYAYNSLMSSQQTYAWNSLRLFIWKNKNSELPPGTICFNFYPTSLSSYAQDIILFYREITVFRGMYWVLDEDMNQAKFKRDFVKNKRARRTLGAGWNDIRIFYDDEAKIFTLEFKNAFGFMRLRAYPLFENLRKPELSREDYLKRYLRYQRSLDSKRKRYDARLTRNKTSYRKTMLKLHSTQWKSFSEVYFSDAEKKLSQNQWLKYYDNIIANEKAAFEGAPVTENLLDRYLIINNYLAAGGMSLLGYDSLSNASPVDFVDQLGNKCVVGRVVVLNTMQKLFSSMGGTLGFEPHTLVVGPSKDVVIIVFLRNGQIGVVSRATYSTFKPNPNIIQKLEVKLFDSKLLTFGQLAMEAGL